MNRMTHAALALTTLAALGLCVPPAARAQGFTLTTLVNFNGTNGGGAIGGLALGTDGSTLYGTTVNGGTNDHGTVFSLNPSAGALTTLVSFDGSNGISPGGLTLIGNTLYGTMAYGGGVFSVDPTTGALITLASFDGRNGDLPQGDLTLVGNVLYGTTFRGGTHGEGNVYSVPLAGGSITDLVNFDGTNGYAPTAGLALIGNTLYGTTQLGGTDGDGTVFSLDPSTGALTTLVNFNGSNGEFPTASLTPSADGKILFGTTVQSTNNVGTVFSLDPSTGALTTISIFYGTNGSDPHAGLTLSADGKTLYGITLSGGANNYGTVFSVPISGGSITTLATFDGTNGINPEAGLTLSADGKTLYGTTNAGGDLSLDNGVGYGTIFALTPAPEPSPLAAISLGILSLCALGLRARMRSVR